MRQNSHSVSCALFTAAMLLLGMAGFPSAEASVNVTGNFVQTHQLSPGGTASGTIVVENGGGNPESVRVYKTNFLYSADGTTRFDDTGPIPRSNMKWIVLDRDQLDLPPGGTATVAYTVTAPDSPGFRGSYWSMIMVEPISPQELAPREKTEETLSMSIKTVTRQAVQIITEVGGEATGSMRFGQMKLTKGEEGLLLAVEFIGEGERILRLRPWIEIYDGNQGLVGKFSGDPFGLHPGCSKLGQIPIPALPKGKYTALIVADCKAGDVFGAQTELIIK